MSWPTSSSIDHNTYFERLLLSISGKMVLMASCLSVPVPFLLIMIEYIALWLMRNLLPVSENGPVYEEIKTQGLFRSLLPRIFICRDVVLRNEVRAAENFESIFLFSYFMWPFWDVIQQNNVIFQSMAIQKESFICQHLVLNRRV